MAGEGNMNMGMTEAEIEAMKDALCSQQQLLQKLYTELDVEREASATAVSEALSMILRLQEEKSVVKMEATQYKRVAEEKISHAEESLANFEDLMYQKEMEIAALEFQVQAYRCKLLSMGVSDVGGNESRYPENLLMLKDDAFVGEMGLNGHVRRLKSLPPIQMKETIQNRGTMGRRRPVTPDSDMVVRIVDEKCSDEEVNDQSMDLETGDLDSYWEQIRKLDERVKIITDKSTNLKAESRTSSLISQLSSGTFYDPRKSTNTIPTKVEQVKDSKMPMEKEALVDSTCSSSVYDVFEVPQVDEISKSCFKEDKGQEKGQKNKLIWVEENRHGKPDLFMEETWESHGNEESELVKKLLRNREKTLPTSRDGMSIECNLALVHPQIGIAEYQPKIQQHSQRIEPLEEEINSTRHGIVAEREEQMSLSNSSISERQSEFEQLIQRVELLESERNISRHDIISEGGEELTLLKEIREQLNSIHSEMRSLKTKQLHPRNDPSILSLQEAMLHFWL